jgi:hypothetical protein
MLSSYLEFQTMDRVRRYSDSGFIDLSNYPFEALKFILKAVIVAFSSNTAPSVGNSSDVICWNVFQLPDVSFPFPECAPLQFSSTRTETFHRMLVLNENKGSTKLIPVTYSA